MKICHLRSSAFFGGPEKAILGQCKALQGYEFTCVSFVRPGHKSEFLERCAEAALATFALPQRHAFDMRPVGTLRRFLSARDVRILVSHDYKSNLFGAAALRGLSVVQIAHFRGRTAEDLKVRLYNYLDTLVLRRIDRVFVVCEAARSELARQGVNPARIRVVPNGIDTTRPLYGVKRVLPHDGQSPVRLIAAGRLSKEKGFDVLIDAATLLLRQGLEFRVDIYGSGPEEGRLRNQIRRNQLMDYITMHGFADALNLKLRDAHALIIPSRSEGMPNVLLEAWANGLAVVATPVGGVPEMIEDQVSGLLSRNVTPASLAEVLGLALRDPERLQALAAAGQERLKCRFSFERQAEWLDTLYREAAGEGSEPNRVMESR